MVLVILSTLVIYDVLVLILILTVKIVGEWVFPGDKWCELVLVLILRLKIVHAEVWCGSIEMVSATFLV